MRISTRGAHAVRCDFKPTQADYIGPGFCSEVFRSYCQLTALRGQLEAARWTVVPGSRTRETEHYCPAHNPTQPVVVTPPSEWTQDPTE